MDSSADTQVQKRTMNDEEEEEQHFSYAMQLATAGTLPMVLLTAFRLGLFEIISKAGPGAKLTPSQIAVDLSSTNPDVAVMVDRMLRLLASHSVLTCSAVKVDEEEGGYAAKSGIFTRAYGLAPAGKYFVRNQELGGATLGTLLELLQDKVLNESWYELEDAVLEGGIPFNRVHGTHLFEYPGRDPRFNQLFNQAMMNHTSIAISRILDSSYKGFEQLKSLVDVGGGLGITIGRITAKYPAIAGILFDLPHVVQHAFTYPGVEHVGGDMFEGVPRGDAIFMKWILHDWDDEHCLKLLKNCYNSLPDNGKVIVVDALLPVNPDTSSTMKASCQIDLIVLAQNPGGKERSEHEFLALATTAGFKGIKKECSVCSLWIMEFYK